MPKPRSITIQFRCPLPLAKAFDQTVERNNATRSETLREMMRSIVKDEARFEATYGPLDKENHGQPNA